MCLVWVCVGVVVGVWVRMCVWVGGCVRVWRVCSLLTFLVCYTKYSHAYFSSQERSPITPTSSWTPACSSVSTDYPPSGSDSTVTVFSSPKATSAVVVSVQNIIASRCMRC